MRTGDGERYECYLVVPIVGSIVKDFDSSAVRKHLLASARFFVAALDARHIHASKLQDLNNVKEEILERLVLFILKLRKKQLKALF